VSTEWIVLVWFKNLGLLLP